MRIVTYGMMVSLDGFVARPDGALDWVLIDEELHTFINNQERETGLYVYGRSLYEVMRYWQTADQDPTILISSGVCPHLAGQTQNRLLVHAGGS